MLFPGSKCGCCGGGGDNDDDCRPCLQCQPRCLTLEVSGFAINDKDECGECDYVDDATFLLKSSSGCPAVVLSVSDPTGIGVQLTYTLEKQANGSCTVTNLGIARECLTASGGSSKSSDEKSSVTTSKNAWPCGADDWASSTYNAPVCTQYGDKYTGVGYSQPTLVSGVPGGGVMCRPARATFSVEITPPKGLFKLVGDGSGATVSISGYEPAEWPDDYPAWAIVSLGSPSGGSGYAENSVVTLDPLRIQSDRLETVRLEAATVRIETVSRVAPPMNVSAKSSAGYSYTGTVQAQAFIENGKTWYRVASIVPGWTWFPICGFSNTSVAFPATAYISDGSFSGYVPITYAEMPTATVAINENGCASGFEVINPGKFYASSGRPTSLTLLTGGAYRTPGAITGVTLTDGGEYWPVGNCSFSSCPVCAACPPGSFYYRRELYATFSVGAESNSVAVIRRDWYDFGGGPRANDTVVISATQSNIDENGTRIDCDGFEFAEDSVIVGCDSNGSITVSSADCTGSSKSYCEKEMPEQITLSLSGMGKFFGWSARNSGSPGTCGCPDPDDPDAILPYEPFCGCDTYDISQRFGGTASGIAGYGGSLCQQDGEAVLDLVNDGCGSWEYRGMLPGAPAEGCTIGHPLSVNCGGELSSPVSVVITPTGLNTSVSIAPPTRGNDRALGEVNDVSESGAISNVVVTYGGSGYAAEIVLHGAPSLTASVAGGSGAVLSVSVTPDGGTDRTRTWSVDGVAVTSGGSGYSDGASVKFSLGKGDVGEGAWAFVNTLRSEPTITASPPESGTGGALAVSLAKFSSWWTWPPKDAWRVDSVTVSNAGSGYTDGDAVTFSLGTNDRAESGDGAYAVIRTTKSEPTVTAAVSGSGTGAVVSPTLQANGGTWSIASVSITNGGAGYSEWDDVSFSTPDVEASEAYAYVSSVDANGVIQSIAVYGGGSYYRDAGTIASVEVQWGGSYFHDGGEIQSVTVEAGGSYYHENHTGQVESDTPAVLFGSPTGTGAAGVAVVDTSLSSDTFGQVTGVNVTNGGEKYRTSGTGWIVSVNVGSLGHLQVLTGSEAEPPGKPDDPKDCANFWDKLQEIHDRVSVEPCPKELLGRSYEMSFNSGRSEWPMQGDGLDSAEYCITTTLIPTFYGPVPVYTGTFFDFGNGPITCSLSTE